MARRITWTKEAKRVYKEILKFYIERNGSKTYSIKLDKEITELISLLKQYPNIGKKTDYDDLQAIVKGDYKIYYKATGKEINIRLVWDCRQNSEDFKLEQ
ncbi:MAG: type II toxin-antitoxin system RelE/ParE family toxin [Chlorobi bacterium]|nr:type II toxin-antitoxin system RelE/ParE family toxin [Chlorobiota bacterium]